MITHDLGVVAGLCDDGQRAVRRARSSSGRSGTGCSRTPRHPYTHGLLALDPAAGRRRAARSCTRSPVGGRQHARGRTGCAFAPRVPARDRRLHRRTRRRRDRRAGGCCAATTRSRRTRSERDRRPRRCRYGATHRCSTSATSQGALPDQARADPVRPHGRPRLRRRRGVADDHAAARPTAWSASPAAASRRSGRGDAAAGSSRPRAGAVRRRRTSRALKGEELRTLRRRIQMVFQDPMSSLDPRQRWSRCSSRACKAHGLSTGPARPTGKRLRELRRLGRACRRRRCAGTRTSSPAGSASASASPGRSCVEPDLIVADEPVSALDVSVQAQVLNLLGRAAGASSG